MKISVCNENIALQKAYEIDTSFYDALCHLGWFLFIAGKIDNAEKAILQALNELDIKNKPSGSAKSYILLFDDYYNYGIYERIDTSAKAKSLLGTVNLNLGHLFFIKGDLEQAKQYYLNSIGITENELIFKKFNNDYTVLANKGINKERFERMEHSLCDL